MAPLDAAVTQCVDTHDSRDDPRCYSIRWACVYTQPQAETWAESNLKRSGYRVWFPTHTVRQRDPVTPSLTHSVIRPLFPRYGFIAFDHRDTSWSPIRATPGVVDLVRCGSLPAYTTDTAVEAVRIALHAAEAKAASMERPDATRRVGALVAPASGPFADHPGVVLAVSATRAQVSLMIFGALRTVSVNLDCLRIRDDV